MKKDSKKGSLEAFKDRFLSIAPYTSIQQKNALIRQSDGEVDPMVIAELLGLSPNNRFEAIAMIFKAREISVSDLIDYNGKCSECNYLDANSLSIPQMFYKDDCKELDISVPIALVEDLTELFSEEYINNLKIKDYDELEQKVFKNNLILFDPALPTKCRKCGHIDKTVFDISSIISKSSISNIYEQYMDISYYSSMTKLDTDSMIPFEREVFLGLIQQKEDEKTKAQNAK